MTGPPVVPVGRYLGLLPVDRPSGPALAHVVRAGGRRVELRDDEQLVWALAHGVPHSPDLAAWNRAAMRRNLPARAAQTDVDATVDRLLGTGLLLEVSGPAEEFARAVRLLPQALGVGNGIADSRRFGLGYPGAPVVAVPTELFYIWSWAGVEDDLWTACARAAEAASPDGTGDPRDLLTVVLHNLHALLAPNVACVDTALRVDA